MLQTEEQTQVKMSLKVTEQYAVNKLKIFQKDEKTQTEHKFDKSSFGF